jgi:glycosyltransferase involved in cell wall biosynthesis
VITVITATTQGREELLAECKASVAAQTHPVAHHLVLLDDKRVGGAHTKNALLEQVTTEWAIVLDDDDLLDPEYVERLIAHAEDADVIYGWCRTTGATLDSYNQTFNAPLLEGGASIVSHCALFRTDFARKAGGFKPVAGYDFKMWQEMLRLGARFVSVPEVLWTYRLNTEWAHESRP